MGPRYLVLDVVLIPTEKALFKGGGDAAFCQVILDTCRIMLSNRFCFSFSYSSVAVLYVCIEIFYLLSQLFIARSILLGRPTYASSLSALGLLLSFVVSVNLKCNPPLISETTKKSVIKVILHVRA